MKLLDRQVSRLVGTTFWVVSTGLARAEAESSRSLATSGRSLKDLAWLSSGSTWLIVLAVVIFIVVYLLFWQQRKKTPWETIHVDFEADNSPFEQILAEMQGLYLRFQSGEGKGDYRKIDHLAKVFLERLGLGAVRSMNDAQIREILNGGALTQAQATAMASILDRCRMGLQEDERKLEFKPLELLLELRGLVREAEDKALRKQPPPSRAAT